MASVTLKPNRFTMPSANAAQQKHFFTQALFKRIRVLLVPGAMKRLIRNKATGKFLKPTGTWSKDASMAMNFSDISAAIAISQRFDLWNVELLMMMEDKPSDYDVTLPLGHQN